MEEVLAEKAAAKQRAAELQARRTREAEARERAVEAERERRLKQEAEERRQREQAAAETRLQREAADASRRRAERLEWLAGEAGRRRQARQDALLRHREWSALALKLQLLTPPHVGSGITYVDHTSHIAAAVKSARSRQPSLFEQQSSSGRPIATLIPSTSGGASRP